VGRPGLPGRRPAGGLLLGFGLLAFALATAGTMLVKKGTWWLRAIVAVAFPLLVWSVYAVVRPAGDPLAMDGVAGGLAIVVAGLVVARAPRSSAANRARAGSHAR
jgi:hypothetical protein